MIPRGPFVASTVIGAVAFWLQAFGRRQNARRQGRGRGRAAELVGDDGKRAALAGEAQHGLHEVGTRRAEHPGGPQDDVRRRSEEHTSELQSLMRISYAVFCLKNT